MLLAVVLVSAWSAEAQKKGEKTVVFHAVLHCENCKARVEKNIPFEKGVKDLKVDLKAQTVTITFREDKNSVEQLRKALEKLNVEVKSEGKNGKTPAADNKAGKKEGCREKQ